MFHFTFWETDFRAVIFTYAIKTHMFNWIEKSIQSYDLFGTTTNKKYD